MMRMMPLFCAMFLSAAIVSAAPSQKPKNHETSRHAFAPGERLTYSISWSKLIQAGVAVMDVRKDRMIDGRPVYRLRSQTKSVGLLDTFYPVRDVVESTVDSDDLCSLSYTQQISHGSRKRQRILTFDREKRTVHYTNGNSPPKTFPVPEHVQDALSSLYYVRTVQNFIVGKPIIVNVHDADKNWAVEIDVVGRERVDTPAGTFHTIKIRTYPRYEGVFMHRGEIFIWLTDDKHKIPVLMKSRIAIGSIVATLTDMHLGQIEKNARQQIKAPQ